MVVAAGKVEVKEHRHADEALLFTENPTRRCR